MSSKQVVEELLLEAALELRRRNIARLVLEIEAFAGMLPATEEEAEQLRREQREATRRTAQPGSVYIPWHLSQEFRTPRRLRGVLEQAVNSHENALKVIDEMRALLTEES